MDRENVQMELLQTWQALYNLKKYVHNFSDFWVILPLSLSLSPTTSPVLYSYPGYQRQLTYKRQDGSYSAFGERDSSGSMW